MTYGDGPGITPQFTGGESRPVGCFAAFGCQGLSWRPAGLKRYLARQLYRTLERLHTVPNTYPQVA
jgi:hypothetical protein